MAVAFPTCAADERGVLQLLSATSWVIPPRKGGSTSVRLHWAHCLEFTVLGYLEDVVDVQYLVEDKA